MYQSIVKKIRKNGFILAQKTLLENERMKFKWPRNPEELKSITKQQLDWLLSGLQIEYKSRKSTITYKCSK